MASNFDDERTVVGSRAVSRVELLAPGGEAGRAEESGTMMNEISVIYPAYNESGNIRSTLDRSLEALRSRFSTFEIIVIDDCSRDDTFQIAQEYAARYPEVRVFKNEKNLGQGGTLRIGFEKARFAWVMHNGIDYPFDLADLDKMIPHMPNADIVVAVRRQRAGYTAFRKLTSKVNLLLLNTLFPLKLRDYNFIQVYRTDVLRGLKATSSSTVFLAPELLIRAYDQGCRIHPVDIDYHARISGVATAGKPKVIVHAIRDTFAFWAKRKMGML